MSWHQLASARYVDSHCHIDLFKNPNAVMDRVDSLGVAVVAVTNAPFVFDASVQLTKRSPLIQTAIGLHPELILRCEGQLPQFLEKIEQTRFVGEVGLDYVTRDESIRTSQRRVFESVVAAADRRGDAFMTVHSRRSASDVLSIIGQTFTGTAVLHWFSGTMGELERAIDAGFYFSVNTAMAGSDKGRRLINRMPRDRVLTESDGPFVTHEGQPATPSAVVEATESIAQIWAEDSEMVRQTVMDNFNRALNGVSDGKD